MSDQEQNKTLMQELELGRAFWHACLICVWGIPGIWGAKGLAYEHRWLVWVAFTFMVVWEMLRQRIPFLWQNAFVRVLIRPKEQQHEITSATYFLLALLLIVYCFEERVVSSALAIAAFADPSARMVGKTIGRHRIGSMRKTWEGTAACFIVAFALVLFLQWGFHGVSIGLALALAVVTALAAVVAELVIPHLAPNLLDDNFWVPFLSAGVLHLSRAMLIA